MTKTKRFFKRLGPLTIDYFRCGITEWFTLTLWTFVHVKLEIS